jgi:membrane-associated phospholipid phosphatase
VVGRFPARIVSAVSVPRTPEPGAKRSVRARLAGGPVARRIAKADLRLYTLVRRDLQVPAAQRVVTVYTAAGEHAALWHAIGVAGLLADRSQAPRWRRAMAGVLVTQLVNTAVKGVFRRRRPALQDLPALVKVPTSLSFPSAHSSSSFAAARAYSALLPARPLYLAASVMALSRVYVGVHYPSDIAVGAALGLGIGSAAR